MCGTIKKIFTILGLLPDPADQCGEMTESQLEFNICVKPGGHFGYHFTADGQEFNVKKIYYDKLIRDRIPEIMEECGKKFVVRQCNAAEISSYLRKKLTEEVDEFMENPSIEELVDIQEVIFSLAESMGYSQSDLEFARMAKIIERGGFSDKWILEEVS